VVWIALWSAGYSLIVTPWPVNLTSLAPVPVHVSLGSAPVDGNSVLVTIDSSAGVGYFVVSACTLTFTSANWNVPQIVIFSTLIPTTPTLPPPAVRAIAGQRVPDVSKQNVYFKKACCTLLSRRLWWCSKRWTTPAFST
jgi:hypothetical protein